MRTTFSNPISTGVASRFFLSFLALSILTAFCFTAQGQIQTERFLTQPEFGSPIQVMEQSDVALEAPVEIPLSSQLPAPASKVSPSYSQGDYAVQKGNMLLGFYAGIKFGRKIMYYDYDDLLGDALDITAAFQPGVTFEYCVASSLFKNGMGAITVGGYFGYTIFNWWHIDSRAALHVQLLEKLSVYAGVVLGIGIHTNVYTSTEWDWDDDDVKVVNKKSSKATVGFDGDLFAGVRYSFTPMVSIAAEVAPGAFAMCLPVFQVACILQF